MKHKGKIDLYIRLSGSETGGAKKKCLRALVEREKDGEDMEKIGYQVRYCRMEGEWEWGGDRVKM